jgi:hypothetical protein
MSDLQKAFCRYRPYSIEYSKQNILALSIPVPNVCDALRFALRSYFSSNLEDVRIRALNLFVSNND